ncbi:hypothetical protein HDG33_007374 [Paraburkholderia sp. Cpub6]|nr:hypothetical protein [Paraburkholderia sp. Cpub6]
MREEFKERRETLSGRERDIHWLVDRAHGPGLTVLSQWDR